MELAMARLFRARWTDEIQKEWIDSVLAKRPDLNRDLLEITQQRMNDAVLDAVFSGYQYLIPTLELPDPDDRHVLAAAIHGRADAIVTFNLRDFPTEALSKYNVEAIHPDDFISFQSDLNEPAVVVAAQNVRSRLKNPPVTPLSYLDTLRQQGLPKTVSLLSPFSAVI